MFVLHIELKAKPGQQQSLGKNLSREVSTPLSPLRMASTRPNYFAQTTTTTNYRLCLTFDHQASQQKWVATELHQEVWPAIADQCADFSVQGYTHCIKDSIEPSTKCSSRRGASWTALFPSTSVVPSRYR